MSAPNQTTDQPTGSLWQDAAWATVALTIVAAVVSVAWLAGVGLKEKLETGDAAFVCGVFSLVFLLLPKYQAAEVEAFHGTLVSHKRRLGAILAELRQRGLNRPEVLGPVSESERLVAQNEMYVAFELWAIRWLPFVSVAGVAFLAVFEPAPWLTAAFLALLLWCTALLTRLVTKSAELLQHEHVWQENEAEIQRFEHFLAALPTAAAPDGTDGQPED